MTFQLFKDQESNTPYTGFRLDDTGMHLTVTTRDRLYKSGFKTVQVYYDPESESIQIEKSDRGYRVSFDLIAAKMGKVMPKGRYHLEDQTDTKFIFIKE